MPSVLVAQARLNAFSKKYGVPYTAQMLSRSLNISMGSINQILHNPNTKYVTDDLYRKINKSINAFDPRTNDWMPVDKDKVHRSIINFCKTHNLSKRQFSNLFKIPYGRVRKYTNIAERTEIPIFAGDIRKLFYDMREYDKTLAKKRNNTLEAIKRTV